jgi:signal transduction histidine kinase
MAFNSKASTLAFFSNSQEFQIGQSLYNCIDEPGKEFIRVIIAKVLNGESIQYDRSYNMENATIAWTNFSATPVFELGEVKNICMVCRDITQQKLMEKEIIDQKIQEQKKIARAIIKVEEKVRNHIGTELHDNINQILATTKMLLGVASKKNEDTKRLVQHPMELIDHSIEEIRLLCHELVTTLKDIDLQIMIRDLLINFGNNTLIKTGFTYLESNGVVSDDLKLNIYRVIQEQLNNVLKHASAKKVNVSVKVDKNSINVTVIDDGIGFDVKEKRKGIGISNIKNRVESYNGKLEIISSPGNGCIINIEVPC